MMVLFNTKRIFSIIFILFLTVVVSTAQPNRFDYGKMWTFENPPKEWFKEAYQFEPKDEWYDDVRLSALKFARWCSASFVSTNGLIMTNHHCSRSVVGALMQEGEDFDKNGFYASELGDERKAEGLFVDQLLYAVDITSQVNELTNSAKNDDEMQSMTKEALEKIKSQYANKSKWENLRLEIVTYYSGGKYSIYGYKRYNDIRLVMIPELDLGFYGGDHDNFTYPRYNLDCTFWRAYNENGEPLNTSNNYFKFSQNGAIENEPVFVVGNPARTERYRTIAELNHDRDYRYPIQLAVLNNRYDILNEIYIEEPSHDLQEQLFGLSNSIKAITGIWEGLNNPKLMQRKIDMENTIIQGSSIEDQKVWNELEDEYIKLNPQAAATFILGPSPIKGTIVNMLHSIHQYELLYQNEADNSEDLEGLRTDILAQSEKLSEPMEIKYLKVFLDEIKHFDHPNNPLSDNVLKGKTTHEVAHKIFKKSWFLSAKKAKKLMGLNYKKFIKCDDPIIELARILIPAYNTGVTAFRSSSPKRKALEQKVANNVFKVKGDNLAPDATFTLRIADGVVKGYQYNGTKAPWHTTYFGLYDRHYSFQKKFPWNLPSKWKNPPMELLKTPMNFVSTNDIIGGNSGSAIINKDKEVVGLIFDGNIESLPGNFIYDEEYNRTVSIHSSGILAAFKYIYKADRLYNELTETK